MSAISAAEDRRAATAVRTLELAELRSATRSRRRAIRAERWRLRSSRADGQERKDKMRAVDPAPWQMLNRLRAFVGCSVFALWNEHSTSGGTASYDEFAAMLTGIVPMPMREHDVTVSVLNRWFEAAGLGAPVATSDDVLEGPLAALQR